MKFKVNYYDIETDKAVDKDCFDFDYVTKDNAFAFTPVDSPVTIYKSVIIDRPEIYLGYSKDKLTVVIDGYQYTKNGYAKTRTRISSVYEEN